MLHTIRSKYYCYSVWRKVSNLWAEYKKLVDSQNVAQAQEKLSEFLDAFQSYHQELVAGGYLTNNDSLDEIYGDLGHTLGDVVSEVERAMQADDVDFDLEDFIKRALTVALLILNDEKYIFVSETKNIIPKLLTLLHTAPYFSTRLLLLKVISVLSRHKENQKDFAQLGGFTKIFALLNREEKELSDQVIATINQFLGDVNIETAELKEGNTINAKLEETKRKPFKVFSAKKITESVSDLKNMIFTAVSEKKEEASIEGDSDFTSFIPTKESINSQMELIRREKNPDESGESSQSSPSPTALSHIDLIKQLLVEQGGLESLSQSTSWTAPSVQLDTLEVICKLLYGSKYCQNAFRKIDGYSSLVRIFDKIPKLSAEESDLFLKQAYKLLFATCLNGKPDKLISILDIFHFFLHTATSNTLTENIRLNSMHCISNLISLNSLNVAYVYHEGAIPALFQAVESKSEVLSSAKFIALKREILVSLREIAVLLSNHNIEIFERHFTLFKSKYLESMIQTSVLSSLVILLSDHLYRKNHLVSEKSQQIVEELLNITLNIADQLKFKINLEYVNNDSAQDDRLGERRSFQINLTSSTDQIRQPSDEFNEEDLANLTKKTPIVKQRFYLILKALGMITCSSPLVFHGYFSLEKGLHVLSYLLRTLSESQVCEDVIELTLWLIKEIIVIDSKHIQKISPSNKWMLDYLCFKQTKLSEATNFQVCHSAVELINDLRAAHVPSVNAFAEEILMGLVTILRTEKLLKIRTAAWFAFGKIISGFENCDFIGEKIGYDNFTELVNTAGVVCDRATFDVLLEIACYGLKEGVGDVSHSFIVQDILQSIKTPQPGVIAKFNSDYSFSHLTTPNAHTKTADLDSDSSDEDSGHFGLGSAIASSQQFHPRSQRPTFSYLKSRSVDSLVDIFDENVQIQTQNKLTLDSQYTQLTKVLFRSSKLTPVVLGVLANVPVVLQKEALKLILVLCNSNPTNTKVLSQGSGLLRTLQLVKTCHVGVRSYYCQLISLLGMYDITPNEAKILMSLVMEWNGVDDLGLSTDILCSIGNISERSSPLSYVNFSGLSGYFRLGLVEKFPNGKTGYTMNCWIKLNAFLRGEQGLISWNNHQTDETIFDLYFKVFPGLKATTSPQHSQRHSGSFARGDALGQQTPPFPGPASKSAMLCVQTQGEHSAPQHFSFDSYNFHEWDAWHHIVLTQNQKQLTLYVNGEMVQSCTTLSYLPPVSRENPLNGYLGRRGAVRSAYFCGQIGPLYFLNGNWEPEAVRRVYNRGVMWNPLSFEAEVSISEQQKPFVTLRPEDYLIDEVQRDALGLTGAPTEGPKDRESDKPLLSNSSARHSR